MHCAHTVAALESYIGLVEMGVGLLPAGGGCKELAINAADNGRRSGPKGDIFPHIAKEPSSIRPRAFAIFNHPNKSTTRDGGGNSI